jgi:hypothetical protein
MSQLISRILLTIVMFPLAAILNFVVYLLLEHSANEHEEFIGALVTTAFMVIYWLLLWRKMVRWTPQRVRYTLIAAVAGIVAGLGVRWIITRHSDDTVGVYTGTIFVPLFWIFATAHIWRETAAERTQRIAHAGVDALLCPSCGYNLAGLREARCPECGAAFTLDELYASQANRAGAEIEAT